MPLPVRRFRRERRRKDVLSSLLPNGFYFNRTGFCPCCDQFVSFESYDYWLRDYFLCENCSSIPRERALMRIIESLYPGWRVLSVFESSPSPRGASVKLQRECNNYLSAFYFHGKEPGSMVDCYRNENLEDLTFENESFDLVVTQDVMEHLYHPENAFKEIARVLKPGGAHIFTVPLVNNHRPSEKWAIEGNNNEPVFLKTPEFHGNPIDPTGCPVTMHWGFDIIRVIADASGMESEIIQMEDLDYGISGAFCEVIVSRKQ